MKKCRATTEEKKRIISLKHSGATLQEIAQATGRSYASITHLCSRLGLSKSIAQFTELTKEIEDRVLLARLEGLRQEQIAEQVGISRSSVQKIYKRHGLKAIIVPHWKITPEIDKRIVSLRQSGLTQLQIATKLGIGRSSVIEAYERLGLEGLPNGKITEELWQQILELKDGGMIIPEIAKIIGVNRASIQVQFNKRGITISKFHITPEIEKVIMQLRSEGQGTRNIAKILGCARSTIKIWLNDRGIKNDSPPPKKKEEIAHKTCTNCLEDRAIEYFGKQKRKLIDGTLTWSYRSECERCRQLRKVVSGAIHSYLKTEGFGGYNISAMEHLPYTVRELKKYIEEQFSAVENLIDGKMWMTWENWGVYDSKSWDDNNVATWTWQIDHIVPHSTFRYTSMEDEGFQECWALSNLRPLNAKQNLLDGIYRTRHPKNA